MGFPLDVKLDEKDLAILRLMQENCKMSTKEMASKLGSPITTVYAKIKRLEELGLIKGYKAVLDGGKLSRGTVAFILASVAYIHPRVEAPLSQREIADEISRFPEVQEVHIISGDWDLLIKIRARDVEEVGRFVVDKLRAVKGIEKTLTCMVFSTVKESSSITV
ncbi:MAG: Lrp/AsnC family transcriptional regulator [Candidatus Bathyarchaeia archaeon]